MELIKNDDSTWTLSKVSELEHLMLSRIPESADPNGCERALDRLYPSPIAPDAELDSDKSFDLENDWALFFDRITKIFDVLIELMGTRLTAWPSAWPAGLTISC